MSDFFQSPILNSPYRYPDRHWELGQEGQPTQQVIPARRSVSLATPIPGFPDDPELRDFAYYPTNRQVTEKLERESPFCKMPFFYWMEYFGGWPFDQEMVSGAFDFNSAPFFQSFLEARVERSLGRIRFILHGSRGPLTWGDIATGGSLARQGADPAAPAEFIFPLTSGQ